MKVLHINSYYSGSLFYKNLYDKQINNGLDIDVYVPVPTSYEPSSFDLGSYTRVSLNHNKYDRIFFYLKHYKIYKDIVKYFKNNEYSLVHAHSLFSNGYIAMKLKQSFGVPYIVAIRNTDVNIFFSKMPHLRKLGIKIMKEAEKIIFLSPSYREIVIREYVPSNLETEIFKKTTIIPNGIDNFWLDNIGIAKEMPNKDKLKLLYVGVIDENKNILTTVKVIENLKLKGYNVDFTVVGRVRDKKVFNLIKDVSFLRYITPKTKEKLIDIYRENDIFIMPSIKETFGLVYAEAMSQGLPVIYTSGQGFDGQFKDGIVGYGVDCYNVEEISDSIIKIVNNQRNMSLNSIKLCNNFNWEKIHLQYKKIYSEINRSYK